MGTVEPTKNPTHIPSKIPSSFPSLPPTRNPVLDSEISIDTTFETQQTNQIKLSESSESSSDSPFIIDIIGIICFVILVSALTVCVMYKRKKSKQNNLNETAMTEISNEPIFEQRESKNKEHIELEGDGENIPMSTAGYIGDDEFIVNENEPQTQRSPSDEDLELLDDIQTMGDDHNEFEVVDEQ